VYMDCLVAVNGAVIDAFTAANPSLTVTNGPLLLLPVDVGLALPLVWAGP